MADPLFHLYTVGACRGNPGAGGAGAVLMDHRGNIVAKAKKYLGPCTNNAAEYRALIMGIETALKRHCRKLRIHLDSELLVNQVKGTYRVKNENLKILMGELRELLSLLDGYIIEHVARSSNGLADSLANEAIDEALK
jgi:ribonuclease HI